MITVALEDAALRLDDVARRAQDGERIVLTRGGRPIADVVPHSEAVRPDGDPPHSSARTSAIDYEAMRRYLDERGIDDPFPYVAPDFDDPLPDDFLLRPLP